MIELRIPPWLSTLLAGVIVPLAGLALSMLTTAAPVRAAEGLPEDVPDLYDPDTLASFERRAQNPYTPPGRPEHLATVLMAPPYATAPGTEQVVYLIGFLTDPRDHRIVMIIETWIRPDNRRNLRIWADRSWLAGTRASGQWTGLTDGRITPPMTREEAKVFMDAIHEQIALPEGR